MFLLASDIISRLSGETGALNIAALSQLEVSPFWGYGVQLLLNHQPLIAKWLVCWCP